MRETKRGLLPLPISFALLMALLGGAASGQAAFRPPQNPPEYRLKVYFDIPRGKILGQTTILAPLGRKLTIDPGELSLKSLEHNGVKILRGKHAPDQEIVLYPQGPVKISYEVDIHKTDKNTVKPGDILLNGMWYPTVEGFCRFRLTAVLPAGYQAVSEAERVTVTTKNGKVEFFFDFSHPLHDQDGINFAASDRFVVSRDTWKGVELGTYFYPEEAHLAHHYLERTKRILEKYEKILGPYPYRRLALVENLQEVTQAMPSFILLDRKDLQPKDPDRNDLEHEIAHQWFGCAVSVDYNRRNWCEGLAIYFAEHLLWEEKGQGWQCRRRILSGFQSHMQRSREFPLRDFTERFDDSSRILGYGKGAMVMHMLRRQVGDQAFFEAIRHFLKANLHGAASWEDLQRSFEKVSGQELSWFFRQWVDGLGQPQIILEKTGLTKAGSGFRVELTLRQEGRVKRLSLPLRFTGLQGSRSFQVDLRRRTETFPFRLDFQPGEVIIDENYEVFRRLAPAENPPTLERLLAAPDLKVILSPQETERYREVIKTFTTRGARLQENLSSTLPSSSLIILGANNRWLEPLRDGTEPLACPASLRVRPHPRSPGLLATFFIAAAEVPAAALEEIFAFPLYSTYCMKEEKQISKTLKESPRGIRLQLHHP